MTWTSPYSGRTFTTRPEGGFAEPPATEHATTAFHTHHHPLAQGDASSTPLTEREFCRPAVELALSLRLRDCRQQLAAKRYGVRPLWLTDPAGDSWACVLFRDDGLPTLTWQGGPRRLWDEAEAAYRWWTRQGEPPCHRFGLTVTPHGRHIWFHKPGNVLLTTP
ncbi:hypothetical protein ACIHFE_11885 [Streptomyces sp. NPDC052396]|uniref:hypothetical protein n=1 Tax=Streptomyces sp. NPDC052396 TaxID=3365689 RepID=UPI0037D780D9